MKQLNNKGFTLIELLATIAIIGLVIGLSTFGIIKVVQNSKEKAKDISMDSIKSSARIYSEEASSSDWKNITNEDYKYFCVTIQELINKGLLKEKEIKNYIENDDDKFNYVVVTKNKLTETVEKEEILEGNDTYNKVLNICTGSIVNEQVKTRPILKEVKSYTDEIDIPFVPAKFSDESIDENGNKVTPKITGNECYYGTTSSNLNIKGEVYGTTCKIKSDNGELKNNNTYYVKVCTMTEKESYICSNPSSYITKDLTEPTITVNNNVTITYKDDNIKQGAGHYFKSTLDGTSTNEVQKCDNNFNCEENTTSITKDTWYKTNDSSVTLTYQNSGSGRVTARITDRSNNYSESIKYISVYKVTFNKGTADKIDGTTTNVSKLCVAETGKTCTIKSPTIEKANYTVIGWNTNSSATTSSWNVGVEKNISNNSTYYPILRINKVYIRFNTNGGTVTGETTTASGNIYKWKTNSSGLISRTNANGSTYSTDFFSINYGSETGSDGLVNYNNSKYLKITKTGYSAVSGSEWICQSGCTTSGKTFSQTSIYSSSDFCDASNSDCTVVLGVNWKVNTYTVTYNANGGSGAPSSQTKTYGVNLTLSSTKPTRTGYTFQGWATTSSATTATYQPGATYTSNANLTLYAVWKANTYTVTYNANGGTGAPSNQTKTHGTDLTLSSTKPTKLGYTFQGWATTSSATTATYQPGATYTSNASITLYAIWKTNTYTITYNANGGTGAPSSQTKTHGTDLTLSSTTPTKAGYTFQGWGTTSNATTVAYKPGAKYTANASITLYAVWKINKVNIRFNTNGGTITGETTTSSGNTYKWKTNSSGLISRTNANGSTYSTDFFSINYGSRTDSDGLINYNNSKYLKITKTGYTAVSGEEWICLGGCTTSGKTFSQTSVYSASDFCDASNGDCTVILGVNWSPDEIKEIADYRCHKDGSDYHITQCSNGICNYDEKDGKSVTGSVNQSDLRTGTGPEYCFTEQITTYDGYRCSGSDRYHITYCSGSRCLYDKKNDVSASGIVLRKSLAICPTFEEIYNLTKVTLKAYNMYAWSASSNCVNSSTCTINKCNTIGIVPAGSTIYFDKCDTANSNSSAKFAYIYVASSTIADKGAGYNYLINGQNNGCGSYIDSSIVTKHNNITYLYVRIPVYCNNSTCGYTYVTEPNVCN